MRDNDVIDPRIDVAVQRAILRMRTRHPVRAEKLLAFVKSGQLRGFVGDDLKMAADHARELGTVRWELVPRGRDAAVVRGATSRPLAVFRASAREDRPRMDTIADTVHAEALRVLGKGKDKPTPPAKTVQRILYAGGYGGYASDQQEIDRIKKAQSDVFAPKWFPNTEDFLRTAQDTQRDQLFPVKTSLEFIGSLTHGTERFSRVVFIGHGFGRSLGLSGDVDAKANEEFDEQALIDNEQIIRQLIRPRFVEGAKIDLFVCKGFAQAKFLKAMADAFGVCVRGFNGPLVWCVAFSGRRITLRGRISLKPPLPGVPCTAQGWFKGVDDAKLQPSVQKCPGSSSSGIRVKPRLRLPTLR